MKVISAEGNEVSITINEHEVNFIHTGLYMFQRQLVNNQDMDVNKKDPMLSELQRMISLFDLLV